MNFKGFWADQDGAITVDWVVLTASIVGIAIAVLLLIAGGINSASSGVGSELSNADSVASLIDGVVETPVSAGLISGNLSDYNNYYDEIAHDHYTDDEGLNFTVDNGTGIVTNDADNEQIGTVDAAGNITPTTT